MQKREWEPVFNPFAWIEQFANELLRQLMRENDSPRIVKAFVRCYILKMAKRMQQCSLAAHIRKFTLNEN